MQPGQSGGQPRAFGLAHPAGVEQKRASGGPRYGTIAARTATTANRADDWLRQAERDLAQARDSQAAQRHECACFAAQQAAEKAVTALHLALGQEAWGHVVAKLLQDLPMSVSADLIDKARVLDNFYVATRYADGHPAGAPFEHYGRRQSGQAIAYAGEILDFARAEMARPRGG